MSTKVVILGKPNVGKSSLFNVFLKKNIAIVHDLPGLTRDIRKKKLKLWDKECELFDTPGLKDAGNDLEKDIIKSTLHYANRKKT
jgi:GTP-binding protein